MKNKELYFSIEEYKIRLQKTRKEMAEKGIEVILSFTPENILYMTGFQTLGYYVYQCLVIPLESEPFMVLRAHEESNWIRLSWLDEHKCFQDWEDPVETTIKALKEKGIDNKKIGVETDSWFLSINNYLKLKDGLVKAKLVDGNGVVDKTRLIKSTQEIEYIRKAARATEKAMQAGIDTIRVGATENDVAAAVNSALIKNGSEYVSMGPFICAGKRTSMAHITWAGKKIEKGDPVFFEIAGAVNRYSAALLRTAFVGEPPADILNIVDIIKTALEKAIATIRPGLTSGEADNSCRSIVNNAGYGDYYRHRLGYSIGVSFPPDWGEGHIVSLKKNDPTILEPGMVFHMPPAVLGYKEWGFGLSETVLVTEKGCECITNFPRKLFVIV